jgi:hypothetical protein
MEYRWLLYCQGTRGKERFSVVLFFRLIRISVLIRIMDHVVAYVSIWHLKLKGRELVDPESMIIHMTYLSLRIICSRDPLDFILSDDLSF